MNPSPKYQFEQKAIHLIHVDSEGKYAIHPDGQKFLSQLQKPIGVVSVAGLYRTGKSYLLNRMLLDRGNGFGVGSTINACTKGLWCWGVPLKGTTREGEKINVIIIDSEGIGACEEDQNHDTKIFTLAVLSASTFIYNSVGSIDENALQNLSLVVNLSKNIQINSKAGREKGQGEIEMEVNGESPSEEEGEEVDPEELAEYFPTFCWVVRDFALQLVDGDGDLMTSNEYLERSLAEQKGFSDDIEDKNRIRRLLTTCFKQRECITLIRPLVSEAKLQKLQQLDLDELRPEFVEQVLSLRKKILNRIEPKKFRGKVLDGKMYLNTLSSYVSAINDGAVPNMENAWTYMCQEKCSEVFQSCCEEVQSDIKELFLQVPMKMDELSSLTEGLKREVLRKFTEETKGMESEAKQFHEELIQIIKLRVEDLTIKNEKQSVNFLKGMALKNFKSIQKSMGQNEYQTYTDYKKAIQGFYTNLIENCPDLPKKQITLMKFYDKAAVQGAEIFIKKSNKEVEQLRQEKVTVEKILCQTKSELTKQIKIRKQETKELDEENTELLANLQSCKKQIESIRVKEKEQEAEFERKLSERKREHREYEDELLGQVKEVKELVSELQKEKYHLEKKLEKNSAVTELKEQQLVQEVEEHRAKAAGLQGKVLEMEEQALTKMQEKEQSYENRLTELRVELEGLRAEKDAALAEKDAKEAEATQQNRKLEAEMFQLEIDYQEMEQELKEKLERAERQREALKKELTEFEARNKEANSLLQSMKQEHLKTESVEFEKMKTASQEFEKDKAVLEQKIQFLKFQVKEMEQNSSKNTQFYESRIKKLEAETESIRAEAISEQSQQLREAFEEKIASLNKKAEEQTHALKAQLETITKQKQQLEFDWNIEKKTLQSDKGKLLQAYEELSNELSEEKQARLNIELAKEKEYEEKYSEYEYRIKELEMSLESKIEEAENSQREENSRSEEAIMQLKNFYELEKEKLEEKLSKEREKCESKLSDQKAYYEERLAEEAEKYEEEYEYLREESMTNESRLEETVATLQHENEFKAKSHENLKAEYQEHRSAHEKKELEAANKIENLAKNLEDVKADGERRLSEVMKEKNKLQRELMNTSYQKDEHATVLKVKEEKIEKLKKEVSQFIKEIEKAKEDSRSKEISLSNEYRDKTIDFETKVALLRQQKEFIQKKNEDLQRVLESKESQYREKLSATKGDLENSLKGLEARRAAEVTELQEKCTKLKKSSKESEAAMSRQISVLEKDLAIEHQKSCNLQHKLSAKESNQSQLEEKAQSELSVLKNSYQRELKELGERQEHLKASVAAVEAEKQQIESDYEKDRTLWENKNQYLEESREKTKKEMAEKCHKYEELIEKLERSRKEEKLLLESSTNEALKKQERKAAEQIGEATALYQKRESELEERVRALEGENRKLAEKIALSGQQSGNDPHSYQAKRIKELQESEKRLTHEIQALKSASKSSSNETFMLFQKEKDQMKQRLNEKEEKLKAAEKAKQEYFFELEKERAKTKLEKEKSISSIEELKETVLRNEKELERLQRENEKLKVERKCSKINLNRYSINKSQFGGHGVGVERSTLEDSSSFLNMSVVSSIKDSKETRSFSRAREIRESREKDREKEKEREKENFKPLLDEQSLFGNE